MNWKITADDLESIAIGAGILGTGGGGNPYLGKLRMREHLRAGRTATVIAPADVRDAARVVSVFNMGAPTVGYERLPQGEEELRALRALEAHLGKPIDAIIPGEIGGSNSVVPLVVSAQTGMPVIDADGMGRAFPELQMDVFAINGIAPTPLALANHKGKTEILREERDPRAVERMARQWAVENGARASVAGFVMSGAEMKRWAIPHMLTLAKRVGDAVLSARHNHADAADAILAVTGGRRLFAGKIVDVERRTAAGFARGEARMASADGARCRIAFQNENLIAWQDAANGQRALLAVVPDLICVIDAETGEPVTTELLRYGLRVLVLGLPAPAQLRTPRALEFVGPRAFGYAVEYQSL
ncbi:MAG: DUF917 domain-containing protein [Chloroflexi bacterium]|nr:DUF917 domain-containing protein [Chloroflexota bacterium]